MERAVTVDMAVEAGAAVEATEDKAAAEAEAEATVVEVSPDLLLLLLLFYLNRSVARIFGGKEVYCLEKI